MKHTPAPWFINHDGDIGGAKDLNGSYRLVTFLPGSTMHGNNPPERAANAHLIAAAPEMLELLRRYVAIERGLTSANAGTRTTERLAAAEALLARIDDCEEEAEPPVKCAYYIGTTGNTRCMCVDCVSDRS